MEVRHLYDHLSERFSKQLQGRTYELVLGKAPAGARPHHSFHVLDVHARTAEIPQSLATLDSCRVSWGRVVGIDGGEVIIERQPLVFEGAKLAFGAPRLERATRQIDGRGFADSAKLGDWVSLHWGWVCEVLTDRDRRALATYTRYHVAIANQTI